MLCCVFPYAILPIAGSVENGEDWQTLIHPSKPHSLISSAILSCLIWGALFLLVFHLSGFILTWLHSHLCAYLVKLEDIVLVFSFLHLTTFSREPSSCTGLLSGPQTSWTCSASGPLSCTSVLHRKDKAVFWLLCMGASLLSSVLSHPFLGEAFPDHPLRIGPSLDLSPQAPFPDLNFLAAHISAQGDSTFVDRSSLATFCVFPPDKSAPGGKWLCQPCSLLDPQARGGAQQTFKEWMNPWCLAYRHSANKFILN